MTSVVWRHGDNADRQLAEAPKDTRSGPKVSGRGGDRPRRPGAVPGAVLLVGGVTLMPCYRYQRSQVIGSQKGRTRTEILVSHLIAVGRSANNAQVPLVEIRLNHCLHG